MYWKTVQRIISSTLVTFTSRQTESPLITTPPNIRTRLVFLTALTRCLPVIHLPFIKTSQSSQQVEEQAEERVMGRRRDMMMLVTTAVRQTLVHLLFIRKSLVSHQEGFCPDLLITCLPQAPMFENNECHCSLVYCNCTPDYMQYKLTYASMYIHAQYIFKCLHVDLCVVRVAHNSCICVSTHCLFLLYCHKN